MYSSGYFRSSPGLNKGNLSSFSLILLYSSPSPSPSPSSSPSSSLVLCKNHFLVHILVSFKKTSTKSIPTLVYSRALRVRVLTLRFCFITFRAILYSLHSSSRCRAVSLWPQIHLLLGVFLIFSRYALR